MWRCIVYNDDGGCGCDEFGQFVNKSVEQARVFGITHMRRNHDAYIGKRERLLAANDMCWMNRAGIEQAVSECFVTCGKRQSDLEQLCYSTTLFAQRKHLEWRASEHHEAAHRTAPRWIDDEVWLIDEVGHDYGLFGSLVHVLANKGNEIVG